MAKAASSPIWSGANPAARALTPVLSQPPTPSAVQTAAPVPHRLRNARRESMVPASFLEHFLGTMPSSRQTLARLDGIRNGGSPELEALHEQITNRIALAGNSQSTATMFVRSRSAIRPSFCGFEPSLDDGKSIGRFSASRKFVTTCSLTISTDGSRCLSCPLYGPARALSASGEIMEARAKCQVHYRVTEPPVNLLDRRSVLVQSRNVVVPQRVEVLLRQARRGEARPISLDGQVVLADALVRLCHEVEFGAVPFLRHCRPVSQGSTPSQTSGT